MSGVGADAAQEMSQSHFTSIRECARRLLSSRNVKFIFPNQLMSELNYGEKFHQLIVDLMDINPALILDIEYASCEVNATMAKIVLDGKEAVQFGGIEPKIESICWVIGELGMIWNVFKKNCLDLAHAGYPGCENCFGENFGKDWSENSSREMMKSANLGHDFRVR